MAKKKGMAYGAFGLEFIGSIFFLVTAAFFLPGGYGFSSALGAWNGSVASLWLPFIYPAAILGSIAVFLVSFANLAGWEKRAAGAANKLAWVVGAVLLLLTLGSAAVWLPIIGFILTFIGAAMTMEG